MLHSLQETQASSYPPFAINVPKVGGTVGNDAFFPHFLGPPFTGNEHDVLNKFLKLKPPLFRGSKSESAYQFILYFYWRLHKSGVVHQHGVEFVTF